MGDIINQLLSPAGAGQAKGKPMAHTYTCLHYHIVFSTLGRRNTIPQAHMQELHAYIGGIIRNIDGAPLAVGGTTNHVHVLAGLRASMALAEAAGKIKANSSRWARRTFGSTTGFHWQEGYGAFAVSRSQVSSVQAYIQGQAEHHRTMSFEENTSRSLRSTGSSSMPSIYGVKCRP